MSAARKELESSLTKLSISSDNGNKFQPKRKPAVADSWEDEASDNEEPEVAKLAPTASSDYPHAPPPTPISPSSPQVTRDRYAPPYEPESFTGGPERRAPPERRQEKTDAVAKRLIAGALGVRAPKKTEEQKAYDKAVREKEVKRRAAEKEREAADKAEAERLKAAAWED